MQRKQKIGPTKRAEEIHGRGALFLDRDGVVIEDRNYLSDPKGVKLCGGAKELIKTFRENGYGIFIITNQSGIARGLFNWDNYNSVTEEMLRQLGAESMPDAIYANGYGPDQHQQSWRKPNPGMILELENDYKIDLDKSILIGDRLSDLEAGEKAGIKDLIHVSTGHGRKERPKVSQKIADPDLIKGGFRIRIVENLECLIQ